MKVANAHLESLKSYAAAAAIVSLPLTLLMFVVVDCRLIFERDVAGQPEFGLIDPTVGIYDGSPELSLLASADPNGAGYFHSHPITITPLHDTTFLRFSNALSANLKGTDAILLRQDRLTTPELRAIAISHELVHVQHGDSSSPLSQESLLHRLWITEEGEAHLRGLETARALHATSIGPAWADYIFVIYNLPITYALAILCIVEATLYRAYRA